MSGTKFYLLGAQPDFSDPASLKAMLSGPEIVMEPGAGQPTDHFDGGDRLPALAPQHGPIVTYVVRFDGAVGDLKDGADVELRGFRIGTVTSAHLSYDARAGTLSTPVMRRTLAQDLVTRLPAGSFVLPDAPAPPDTRSLVVTVLDSQADANGTLTLQAAWTLLSGRPARATFSQQTTLKSEITNRGDAAAQAAALSRILGQLADQIATSIVAR